ncbi:hypothetical protein N7468_003519 [Penicillium chermesinum]|uniref:Uncharacterized protein n=1 Tax=Penicillium chermesinum TaxID=63820 RepID=A0A9W9TRP6_9EURO|nr:uncharacterized protein N7468_003519 [Penicillium chermesinum]KAJ5238900.1 hypothetical protein N7468_003519 [Penicillium chermesinum]KAJ6164538.1 hypothetical protein N7470_003210 [Penicillium chermesinum]
MEDLAGNTNSCVWLLRKGFWLLGIQSFAPSLKQKDKRTVSTAWSTPSSKTAYSFLYHEVETGSNVYYMHGKIREFVFSISNFDIEGMLIPFVYQTKGLAEAV